MGAAMALQPALSGAELLKNFKVDGSLETQAVSARNISFLSTPSFEQIGDAQTRILLNLGWDLLDDVHANVTIRKRDRIYGTPSQSAFGVQSVAFFDQANVKIDKLIGDVDAKVGRQFFGEPGDLVAYFGPQYNIYGLGFISRALDAGRFDWANDQVGVTGVVGKIIAAAPQGGVTGTDSGGTFDLQALIVTLKGNENLSGGLQVYREVQHESFVNDRNPDDYLWVPGAKAKWTAGGAWVKGEVDKNFGEDRALTNPFPNVINTGVPLDNYDGWAFLVDAGYKADVAGFGGVTPWGQFGAGSGGSRPGNTFQDIAGDYRPGAIYGLFAPGSPRFGGGGSPTTLGSGGNAFLPISSETLSNRVIWGFGVKAAPSNWPKVSGGVSFWDYRFQTSSGGGGAHTIVAGQVADGGNKHLGSEADINVNYNHSDNVSTGITLGQFWPGGAVKNADSIVGVPSSPATLAQANLTIKY